MLECLVGIPCISRPEPQEALFLLGSVAHREVMQEPLEEDPVELRCLGGRVAAPTTGYFATACTMVRVVLTAACAV